MIKPKSAAHIKALQHVKSFYDNPDESDIFDALAAAIRALKAESKSPWRKVTKRHPGKKWVGRQVRCRLEMSCTFPAIEDWEDWQRRNCVDYWRPERSEKGKVK